MPSPLGRPANPTLSCPEKPPKSCGYRGVPRALRAVGLLGGLALLLFATWGASQPLSPKRSQMAIAPDTRWATTCYVRDSGKFGPVVLVIGGLYGDEPAGAYAADEIRHWPLVAGKLVVVPRANVPALAANVHQTGGSSPAVQDGDQPGDALWQLIRRTKPDWLVDLGEATGFRSQDARSQGSTVAAGRGGESAQMAARLVAAVNHSMPRPEQPFVVAGRPSADSLDRAAEDRLGSRVLYATTTRGEEEPLSRRIRQHRVLVHSLLSSLGMIESSVSVDWITDRETPSRATRIALYMGPGTRKGLHHLAASLEELPQTEVVPVGPEEINAGVLDEFQLVIFPGGSGTKQGEALGGTNRDELRRFVHRGGGYLGICAGAYLATTDYPWSLGIIDAKPNTHQWKRGRGLVEIELTDRGRQILGADGLRYEVRYHNGPILVPAHSSELDGFQTLARFKTEIAEGTARKGVMIDSPAIISGNFGRGRVVLFSPHPDQTRGLETFVCQAARWVAEKAPRTSSRPGEG